MNTMSLFVRTGFSNHDGTSSNNSNVSVFQLTTMTTLATSVGGSEVDMDENDGNASNIPQLKFVVWGVLGTLMAIPGFLGNTLSMVVLQRRQMRSSTSYYLFSLAIYDNLILLGMTIYFILPALAPYTPGLDTYSVFYSVTLPFGYPLSLTAQMASIYTCVGFTVERFIAVYKPLHVAKTCTRSRTLKAIALISIWSFLYNVPRFFHYHAVYPTTVELRTAGTNMSTPSNASAINTANLSLKLYDNCTSPSHTSNWENLTHIINASRAVLSKHVGFGLDLPSHSGQPESTLSTQAAPVTMIGTRETSFGSSPLFQHIYLIYSQLFFMFLLPFLVILIMNVGLIRAVKRSKSMRQSMSASASKEHNLTVMLIAVIVAFLVCQFPTIIDNILVAVVGEVRLQSNYRYKCFYIVCTFMVAVNSTTNFLLYCFFGKKFRLVLLSLLGLKRRHRHVAYRSTVCKSRTNGTRFFDMEVSVM